ncbi:hypothetical protein TrLO_g3692 [Triparma laevis f. longispina]|nr:hypothetical protein TrLO_g3692 [Triparma laevis f. longispina]
MTSDSKFSLKKTLRSVRLVGLARCTIENVRSNNEEMFEGGVRARLSDEQVDGVGRPSFHSPVSDVVKLNQLLRASSRAHDRRRKVYSTYISLGFSGVVDECFNNFDSIVDEGVRRLKLFYSDGYFSESNYNSELNRLVTGSYCAVKIVQSVCGEREIRGFMEITSARERYENAIEVMERHTVEMLREINEGDERPGGLV